MLGLRETFEETRSISKSMNGKVYIETYGCQMNFSDSEIIVTLLKKNGYSTTDDLTKADVIFINTCSIREQAEKRVRRRLKSFSILKKNNPEIIIGVIGCMAERLKKKLFEENADVDVIVGPDAYRNLPDLIEQAQGGQKVANTFLSLEETYHDIVSTRKRGISAFLSIMRGCDNMCSFCVVPFTRGRERSRSVSSILSEIKEIAIEGRKEITLLGQNVNSYFDEKSGYNFAKLLDVVSQVDKSIRIRFTTSNPEDISEELIEVMEEHSNICKFIHLPVQSGSTRILKLMNRKYSQDEYLKKIDMIRTKIPNISFSTDIICGFCTETEVDHKDTIDLLKEVKYDQAYTFMYSERSNTLASRCYEDDVKIEVKHRRLEEVINVQRNISLSNFKKLINNQYEVLVEGESKRSKEEWVGRTDRNQTIVFPKKDKVAIGDIVKVKVLNATSATLIGEMK